MRLLLIEDDAMLGEALVIALREGGHAVDWLRNARMARTALNPPEHEVLLLDLGLPDGEGLDLLRDLRARGSALPVLILSARDALETRIEGLDSGADDYLVKPFASSELLARLRVLQRRQGGGGQVILSNGKIHLDPTSLEAWREGAEDRRQHLGQREFALLSTLLARPGVIFSRQELETRLYPWGEEVESNSIDFLIHSLRRKLGADAIKNIRGAGWLVERRA
ncbi:MAG: response regulator [Acidithiobacillus sp.]|uniref:response regulator n=1 Tax=Acidithiobacillus sp. TaxID=1872118 RepID=UPI003CFDDE4A